LPHIPPNTGAQQPAHAPVVATHQQQLHRAAALTLVRTLELVRQIAQGSQSSDPACTTPANRRKIYAAPSPWSRACCVLQPPQHHRQPTDTLKKNPAQHCYNCTTPAVMATSFTQPHHLRALHTALQPHTIAKPHHTTTAPATPPYI
jgi:hypothetical protein